MPDTHRLHILRKRLFFTTAILSAGILCSYALILWSLKASHDSAIRERGLLCHAQNQTNDALRNVLKLAQSLAQTDTLTSPAEYQRAQEFYSKALRLVGRVPCKN